MIRSDRRQVISKYGRNLAFPQVPAGTSYLAQVSFAFSSRRVTRHALVFASLRQASVSTRSPCLYSLFSSWAWYFFERVTTFPYSGCFTRCSTSTVIVLFILSL